VSNAPEAPQLDMRLLLCVAALSAAAVVPPPACQSELCQLCFPTNVTQGSCCNATWSCVYDVVFQKNICLPPTPWICSPPPHSQGSLNATQEMVERPLPLATH